MKATLAQLARRDWQAFCTRFLAFFDAQDRALVAAGFPATSPWWRKEIERFFRSGCRRWVLRVGRRGGKSSTLCRVAVAWALFCAWTVPPGDIAVIPFLSTDRDEASGRLRTIRDVLTALGVKFDERGEEIELRDIRLVFKVVTASIKGVVGFTAIAIFADEMARWEARDSAANPAPQTMGSLRPTMATQPLAFEVCSSSPWGSDDYHAELFDAGDTAHQVASYAPTWGANPTISKEQTRALEPDERIWAREYLAEPGVTITAAIDPTDIANAFGRPPSGTRADGFVSIDASSLRADDFAYIAGNTTDAGELVVVDVDGWGGKQLQTTPLTTMVETIARTAKSSGTATVYGDQREEAALTALFRQHDVTLKTYAWSLPSKDAACQWLRRMFREGRICLPHHPKLRRELTAMKARLLPSGVTRYETNGLDYASALITTAHAALDEQVSFSAHEPITQPDHQESRWAGAGETHRSWGFN